MLIRLRAMKGKFKEEAAEMCDESILCAQKQRSDTCTPHNPYEAYVHKEGTINTDSESQEDHISSK